MGALVRSVVPKMLLQVYVKMHTESAGGTGGRRERKRELKLTESFRDVSLGQFCFLVPGADAGQWDSALLCVRHDQCWWVPSAR